MTATTPAIPMSLSHLPVVGGMAVPWITPRTRDGRFLFGVLHPQRLRRALLGYLCQVCGKPLERPLVLLMRLSDLPRRHTVEPALHSHCAAYTASICPMVAGRMTHYRSTLPLLDETMTVADDAPARLGAPAEPWFQVWLHTYRVITAHQHLAASYAEVEPLRIRSITSWLR